MLIDTPGLRELGLLDDVGGVETSFADVAAFAETLPISRLRARERARLRRARGVASGELPAERLASYRKLLKEIAAAERKRDPILAGRTKSALERSASRNALRAPRSIRSA